MSEIIALYIGVNPLRGVEMCLFVCLFVYLSVCVCGGGGGCEQLCEKKSCIDVNTREYIALRIDKN